MGETDGEQVPRGKDEKDFEKRVKECLKLSGGKRMGAGDASRSDAERSNPVRRSIQGIMTAGRWSWKSLSATECVTTNLPNQLARKWMALKRATYTRRRGKSQASMSRRARRSLQNLEALARADRPSEQILDPVKIPNRDVAVDGNVRESGDVGGIRKELSFLFNSLPTLETAQPEVGSSGWKSTARVAWCRCIPAPLKIRRTECRSRPVVLITASGLQGEQPLVDGTMQGKSAKWIRNRKRIGSEGWARRSQFEPVDCWRTARAANAARAHAACRPGTDWEQLSGVSWASNSQLRTGTDKGNPTV
ncbi:LOW QUALITY PROTEIN: hypothetical protein Bca4012_102583 [Brassica carinata]